MAIGDIGLLSVVFDVSRRLDRKVFHANENDYNGRGLEITIKDNGVAVDCTGVTVRLGYIGTDGVAKGVDFTPVNVATGVFSVHYPTDMIRDNGGTIVKCTVTATDATSEISFENIFVYVNQAEVNDSSIEANSEFSSLQTAINAANEAKDGYIADASSLETTYAPRLTTVESQLAEKEKDILTTQNKQKPKTVRPIVTFSFDDGTIYDHDNILPLFNSKGIVGTTGIIHDKIGTVNYMTIAQIKAMKNAGWEIASHSKTHSISNFTTLTQEQLEVELRDSKTLLNNLELDVKNFLIPYGFTNDNIAKTAAKYYRSMRVSGGGSTGTLNSTPIATFNINSLQLGDSAGNGADLDSAGNVIDSLAQWKYWVDQAIANKSWLVFISHSNNVAINYNRMADLAALIDYVKSLNVDILTIDEALNTFENQVDADKFKVGADGKVGGEYGKFRNAPADTVLNGTALTDIDTQQTTVNVITAGNSAGFVNSSGGTIMTVKPDNEPRRAFQLGKGYGDKQPLQFRDFALDGTPGPWRTLENVVNHPDGTIASAHTPPSFVRYAVNICYIPQANATGYPENTAGFLTAWFYNDYGSCYEEYKMRNSDKKYTRYWDSVAAAWSPWSVEYRVTSLVFDSLTAASLLTAFPFGVSFLQITAGNSAGMPTSNAYLLETRRTSPNGYNYQFAHLYDSTATHKRVAKADGTWSAWVSVNA